MYIRSATGTLGAFQLRLDGLRQMIPAGRGAYAMTGPRDGALSECDLIVDLTGGPALFPSPDKRDGYLRGQARIVRDLTS